MKATGTLAPLLEAFFTERLQAQRKVSGNTVAAYRDAFRLLLRYAQQKLAKDPCALMLADLGAPFITGFLDHLEKDRKNAILERIITKNICKTERDHGLEAKIHQSPGGMLARRTAAEIITGQQDARTPGFRPVQYESWIRRAIGAVAPVRK